MWKVVRIPAGDITNLHYNFVVAKPLVFKKSTKESHQKFIKPKIYRKYLVYNTKLCGSGYTYKYLEDNIYLI